MKRIAPIGIVLSLWTGSALAADLPLRDQAPPYYAAPMFTWTGFYAGINGGLAFGGFTNGGSPFFGDTAGGLVGGTVGYNFQGGPIVVGIEADLDWASINGSRAPLIGVSGSSTVDEVNTVRGRLGYSFDRALVYATGGWSAGSVSGRVTNLATAPGLIINESHYLNGYAVGVGLEYLITPKFSVKAEYLFNSLQPSTYFGGTVSSISSGINYSTLKAGVNYHF